MFILSFGYFSFPRVESAGMFSSRSSSASFFIFVYPPVGKVCGLHSFWFFGLILGFSARSFCARLCAREGFRSQLVFISWKSLIFFVVVRPRSACLFNSVAAQGFSIPRLYVQFLSTGQGSRVASVNTAHFLCRSCAGSSSFFASDQPFGFHFWMSLECAVLVDFIVPGGRSSIRSERKGFSVQVCWSWIFSCSSVAAPESHWSGLAVSDFSLVVPTQGLSRRALVPCPAVILAALDFDSCCCLMCLHRVHPRFIQVFTVGIVLEQSNQRFGLSLLSPCFDGGFLVTLAMHSVICLWGCEKLVDPILANRSYTRLLPATGCTSALI
jgi:hypothetical protein